VNTSDFMLTEKRARVSSLFLLKSKSDTVWLLFSVLYYLKLEASTPWDRDAEKSVKFLANASFSGDPPTSFSVDGGFKIFFLLTSLCQSLRFYLEGKKLDFTDEMRT